MYRYYQTVVDDENKFQGFVCSANKNMILKHQNKRSWDILEGLLSQKAMALGLHTHANIIVDKSIVRRK